MLEGLESLGERKKATTTHQGEGASRKTFCFCWSAG